MKKNPLRAAYLLIDMQKGFVDAASVHCIPAAAATVPACRRTMERSRQEGIPVFFIRRSYRADGSDVENTRYAAWAQGGRSMTPGAESEAPAPGLEPLAEDYVVVKPRWSAFFATELDLLLRRLDIRNIP